MEICESAEEDKKATLKRGGHKNQRYLGVVLSWEEVNMRLTEVRVYDETTHWILASSICRSSPMEGSAAAAAAPDPIYDEAAKE